MAIERESTNDMSSTPDTSSPNIERLGNFVIQFGKLVDSSPSEERVLDEGVALLRALVSVDDWLPSQYAEPDPARYRQYLLYADPQERFSVVSFVWGPGQTTPIHDHTVWGLIGMLRGGEHEQHYKYAEDGTLVESGSPHLLKPGEVDVVSPTVGDLHRVSNSYTDRVSISIHVYGASIGDVRRSVYEQTGAKKGFISGYSNTELLNLEIHSTK
jgi:predicted metal-dependent enzyme (double-stranded beta helix superfamily)